MSDRVALEQQSLADWSAQWDAQERRSAAQKRWREHEREWRINLAAQGLLPADRLVADIRSGAKERRDRQNTVEPAAHPGTAGEPQAGRLQLRRRASAVAPALTRIDAPSPGRTHARPRERRARRACLHRRAPLPATLKTEPGPQLRVIPLADVSVASFGMPLGDQA